MQVIELDEEDPIYKTKTIIKYYSTLGDGPYTLFDYNNFGEIPTTLPDGTQISIDLQSLTAPMINTLIQWYPQENAGLALSTDEAYVVHGVNYSYVDWLTIYLILKIVAVIVVALSIVMVVYFFTHPQGVQPPCGEKGYQIDVTVDCISNPCPTPCYRTLVYPDCSSDTIDTCDGTIIAHSDAPKGGMDWVTWVIIGVIAIGALYVVSKLIPEGGGEQRIVYPQTYGYATGR